MNERPDLSIIQEVSQETGIAEPFVEKDWFVTQAVNAVSGINIDGFEVVFSGGTALSKAHGLLKRFSEDVDFRVLAADAERGRKALSVYKNAVIEALRQQGFPIKDEQIMALNGNRFFSVDLDYESQFSRANALRPHIQVELTVRGTQLSPLYMPVSSFINHLSGQSPEVERIGCIDPVESAADKLSALAWRIPDRVRGDQYDDPAVVRHVHDLAILKDIAEKSDKFSRLVISAMQHDDRRSKNNAAFSGLPVAEKFQQMFAAFDRDEQYGPEYDLFVKGVSYAPAGAVPDFDAAMDAVRALVKIVTT
jgi:hypothetical protein